MTKMIMAFALLTVLIGVGITVWRDKTAKERWGVIKTYLFGALCALIAIIILMFIVVLF